MGVTPTDSIRPSSLLDRAALPEFTIHAMLRVATESGAHVSRLSVSLWSPSERRAAGLLLTLALLPSAALVGCGRDVPPVLGTKTIKSADRSEPFALSGPTLDGGTLEVADLRGRIVIVNNWASWCAPCREETPVLVALASTSDPHDVAVIGMNVSDHHDAAAFAKEFKMPYPSIEDKDGTILATIPGVPPSALPSTIILDRSGRVAARIIGKVNGPDLALIVAGILGEN